MSTIGNWIDRKIIKRSATVNPTFHNTNRVARILYRFGSYSKLSLHMIRQGIPPSDIVRSQFPLFRADAPTPVQSTLEFTNYCNLRCPYCTSPLGLRPKGFMDGSTFDKTVSGLSTLGVKRIVIIGNGEPTLHPEFGVYIRKLASVFPYVTVLSNGQWRKAENVVEDVLSAPLKMLEVSVDGGDKDSYEISRVGGKFENLIKNLSLLKKERDARKTPTMINLRLMLRPSQQAHQKDLKKFWSQYADTVMIQHLVERKALSYNSDLYTSVESVDESFPKCALPFNVINVDWNGDVPLCNLSARQVGPPGLIVGNVNTDFLADLWHGHIMRQYREGHKSRDEDKMPICKGCIGS